MEDLGFGLGILNAFKEFRIRGSGSLRGRFLEFSVKGVGRGLPRPVSPHEPAVGTTLCSPWQTTGLLLRNLN